MNADTLRLVRKIKEQGYFTAGQTLGAGGWPELYNYGVGEWKEYVLVILGDTVQSIHAENDLAAIKGFEKLYDFYSAEYEIQRRTVSYETISKGE